MSDMARKSNAFNYQVQNHDTSLTTNRGRFGSDYARAQARLR